MGLDEHATTLLACTHIMKEGTQSLIMKHMLACAHKESATVEGIGHGSDESLLQPTGPLPCHEPVRCPGAPQLLLLLLQGVCAPGALHANAVGGLARTCRPVLCPWASTACCTALAACRKSWLCLIIPLAQDLGFPWLWPMSCASLSAVLYCKAFALPV